MHVRLRQKGRIDFGADLREDMPPTADVVFISAHDSELALLSAAAPVLAREGCGLTVCNYLSLLNPKALPAFIRETLGAARIVVLRMIGGEGYWPEAVDALRAWAHGAPGRTLHCLPGGTQWDEGFAARGTADIAETRMLWRYLTEGGAANAEGAAAWLARALGRAVDPPDPAPMPAAGFLSVADAAPADALLVVYRALAQAGDVEPAEAMRQAFHARGLRLAVAYATSLKDEAARAFLRSAIERYGYETICCATAFAADTPALFGDRSVLQVAFAGMARRDWAASARGLPPSDLAMHVMLPEVDGRIFAGPAAFKTVPAFEASGARTHAVLQSEPRQIAVIADRAAALIRLRRAPAAERRIAIFVANYPNCDGRLANGVGLDTPASVARALAALSEAGYAIGDAPADGAALMERLSAGVTNAIGKMAAPTVAWPLADYREAFAALPEALREACIARWGDPEFDPFAVDGAMHLSIHRFGNVTVAVQPSRGYDVDPAATFHDPDLVPPHRYIASYLWLRHVFDAHALVHFGKHGNLEWLPGKAVGLSAACWPQALLGPLPHVYPFIVNDPGEGMQAKRRTAAVIVDHLTPPMARAELHGDMARLENLVDEFALAQDVDPRRARTLADEIATFAGALRLDADAGAVGTMPTEERVRRVDAFLCDIKEMQIRDGLHVFGQAPAPDRLAALAVAIARVPRVPARPAAESLHRAIAADLGLAPFDPLTRDLAFPWAGPRPDALAVLDDQPWRTAGDTVERIERLALDLVSSVRACPPEWERTAAVLAWIDETLRPALQTCATAETVALLDALAGRAVPPGPSGAPSRGRPDVLPTGRNFYAVDARAVPTPAAWRIGLASAEALVARYRADTSQWLRTAALSAWGTANMRTGGDDVAQALALIGCRPVWEEASGRVTGFEVLTSSDLKRPRVDVTFRASGLFRDAFPVQLDLLDSAIRAVAALDEDDDQNPIAAAARRERGDATRVFASMPGAYGAGLQALVDSGAWTTRRDFADAYLAWGGFAYGGGREGVAASPRLKRRLRRVEAVLQAQDNREHDILDSDDYYQFMGGLASTVESLSGKAPRVYLTDTSRPEDPLPRALSEEIARVVRGRAANPKWIAGCMRHGHKGAFEMAATVDYLFAFAATTDAVGDQHFDALFDTYLADGAVRAFIAEANPAALKEMAERFAEAMARGLWRPRSNSAGARLAEICGKE
jgi:cobaltochelatase CobN